MVNKILRIDVAGVMGRDQKEMNEKLTKINLLYENHAPSF